jgi:hypothetical protein
MMLTLKKSEYIHIEQFWFAKQSAASQHDRTPRCIHAKYRFFHKQMRCAVCGQAC